MTIAELRASTGQDGAATEKPLPPVPVQVRRLHPQAPLPRYALDGDAGADLCTMIDIRLRPGERALLPTGLAIALPPGYAGFVHPRSGLAGRAGLGLLNAPGTIDSGYRGELKVIVINHDRTEAIELHTGDRIAQLVIQRVERAEFKLVDSLPESERGTGGHGSTGGAGALSGDAAARPAGDAAARPAGRTAPFLETAFGNDAFGNDRGDDQ